MRSDPRLTLSGSFSGPGSDLVSRFWVSGGGGVWVRSMKAVELATISLGIGICPAVSGSVFSLNGISFVSLSVANLRCCGLHLIECPA